MCVCVWPSCPASARQAAAPDSAPGAWAGWLAGRRRVPRHGAASPHPALPAPPATSLSLPLDLSLTHTPAHSPLPRTRSAWVHVEVFTLHSELVSGTKHLEIPRPCPQQVLDDVKEVSGVAVELCVWWCRVCVAPVVVVVVVVREVFRGKECVHPPGPPTAVGAGHEPRGGGGGQGRPGPAAAGGGLGGGGGAGGWCCVVLCGVVWWCGVVCLGGCCGFGIHTGGTGGTLVHACGCVGV